MNTIRPEDHDLVADVIWFIKGAQSLKEDYALRQDHIQALIHYRESDPAADVRKTAEAQTAFLNQMIVDLRNEIAKLKRRRK